MTGGIYFMQHNGRVILSIASAFFAFVLGLAASQAVDVAVYALQGTEPTNIDSPAATAVELEEPAVLTDLSALSPESVPDEEPVLEEYETGYAGTYYLWAEELPKAFSDLEFVDIETHALMADPTTGSDEWLPIPPKGSVAGKKNYKIERLAIGRTTVAFSTATVNGVSYRFTGRFPMSGDHAEPAMEGRLIKIENGKWAAEMWAEFYVGGC